MDTVYVPYILVQLLHKPREELMNGGRSKEG